MLVTFGFWIVYITRCSRYTGIEWWSLFRLIFCIRMYFSKSLSVFPLAFVIFFSLILANKFQWFAVKIQVNIVSVLQNWNTNEYIFMIFWIQFMLIWGHKHPIQLRWILHFLGLLVHELGKSKLRKFLALHVARKYLTMKMYFLYLPTFLYSYRPDEGCLQYNTGLTGRITSFNFIPTDETHLQNQKYMFSITKYIFQYIIICIL